MDERRLRIFQTVAELCNFTRAAEVLHMAQPTVSQQIQSLEAELDVRLFDRTSKSVSLTPAGRILYTRTVPLLRQFDDVKRAMAEAAGNIGGPLTVGASLTIGQYVLPQAVANLLSQYPAVQLHLGLHNTEKIVSLTEAGHLDLGLVEGPVPVPDLVQEVLLEDELVIIAPAHHPWRHKDTITLADLQAEPHILREPGSGTRQVLEEHLHSTGVRLENLNVVTELPGIETIKGAVEAGMGVAAVSRWTVRKELQLGTVIARTIRKLPMKRTFRAIYPRGRTVAPAAAALLELLRDVGVEAIVRR